MSILIPILLFALFALILTLLFFQDKVLPFILIHWKKILGVTIGGMVISGGLMLPRDDPPSAGESEALFYYNAHTGNSGWVNPDNMNDSNIATFAAADANTDNITLNSNNYSSETGTIDWVYFRVYHDYDGTPDTHDTEITPIYDGATYGTEVDVTTPATPDWSAWQNITSGDAPWTWTEIENLDFRVMVDVSTGRENGIRVAKLEIKVAYTADVIPPTCSINFAGNPGDVGSPYYIPPAESGTLATDGYYANNSYQTESFINMNITVEDTGCDIDDVKLHLYDATSDSWSNTSDFVQGGITGDGYFYTLNKTGLTSNHKYSFDVWFNDTEANDDFIFWNKTGIGGSLTRRYVTLGCTETAVDYNNSKAWYWNHPTYTASDANKPDRLMYDQGLESSLNDTSYVEDTLPIDTLESTWCGIYISGWLSPDFANNVSTINNIYYHNWVSLGNGTKVWFGYNKTSNQLGAAPITEYITLNITDNESSVYCNTGAGGSYSYDFNLMCGQLNLTSPITGLTDNNIYEVHFPVKRAESGTDWITVTCNRSIMSYILINVPSNTTLGSTDTDSDGLTDVEELWTTYTHPFISDTDNDGINDYYESLSGSDPNNYSDTIDINPSVPTSFIATMINTTKINLAWTKGANYVDTTYIERNATAVASWAREAGTMIYNSTGTAYSDTGLMHGTHYYYQAWSYNATQNVYSTTNASTDSTTLAIYDTSVRTNGIDYFVWLGDNTSAWHIYQIINSLGFDEGIEYIAVWRNQ